MIGMARSSFYYKPVDRSAKTAADAEVVDQLRKLARRWPQYGYRRMAAALKAGGTVVNHKRLLRLMRESDLTVRPRRRYVRTTNSDHPFPIARNLYATTAPTAANQLWVSDITYSTPRQPSRPVRRRSCLSMSGMQRSMEVNLQY